MPAARNKIRLPMLLATSTLLIAACAPIASFEVTASGLLSRGPSAAPASPACETARREAWVDRQMRRADGDNEPLEPAEPAACAR